MKAPSCPYCESDQVLKDAYAQWDYTNQEWTLYEAYDNGYCQECESSISDVELHTTED